MRDPSLDVVVQRMRTTLQALGGDGRDPRMVHAGLVGVCRRERRRPRQRRRHCHVLIGMPYSRHREVLRVAAALTHLERRSRASWPFGNAWNPSPPTHRGPAVVTWSCTGRRSPPRHDAAQAGIRSTFMTLAHGAGVMPPCLRAACLYEGTIDECTSREEASSDERHRGTGDRRPSL